MPLTSHVCVSECVCVCESQWECKGDRHPGHKTHSLRLRTSWQKRRRTDPSQARNHNRKNMLRWNYI